LAGSCEHSNEPSSSMEGGKSPDLTERLSAYGDNIKINLKQIGC